jgi:hypothetical protein
VLLVSTLLSLRVSGAKSLLDDRSGDVCRFRMIDGGHASKGDDTARIDIAAVSSIVGRNQSDARDGVSDDGPTPSSRSDCAALVLEEPRIDWCDL